MLFNGGEWEREGERERERGCEATHFLLAKFPQSLWAFALIPSFISHILLYIIKTFLKWACACLFYFLVLYFSSANILCSTWLSPFFLSFFFALYHISLDASPKFRMANIRAELGENLSAVGHCARVSVLLYFLSYGGDPLCVNKEHEDETELCVLLTRRW